jgi:hypothetical protein
VINATFGVGASAVPGRDVCRHREVNPDSARRRGSSDARSPDRKTAGGPAIELTPARSMVRQRAPWPAIGLASTMSTGFRKVGGRSCSVVSRRLVRWFCCCRLLLLLLMLFPAYDAADAFSPYQQSRVRITGVGEISTQPPAQFRIAIRRTAF